MSGRRRWCALVALAAGCSPVTFVDPDAEAKARLRLAAVEHLDVRGDPRLYLHVQLASRTATQGTALVALTAEGTFQLPWRDAVQSDCGPERTCAAFTLGPGLPAPEAVALLAPALGHQHEVKVVRRQLEGYGLEADAVALNQAVQVNLLDPIRRYYAEGTATATTVLPFRRRFEAHLRAGACGAAPAPTSAGWRRMPTLPAELPALFSAAPDPLACVWVRPALPPGGPAVGAQTVGARAEVYRFRHVYTPPIEQSPMVFLPMFDLEIPNPTRCEEAEGLVQSAILDAATEISERTGAQILALPPLELAEVDQVACRQANLRTFDAAAVVARARDAIEARFGDRPVRILWIYVQNLDLALPEALEQAFLRLRAGVRDTTAHVDFLFALAPNVVQDQLQADRHLAWVATEEPQFRGAIGGLLAGMWPFTTVLHDLEAVISLAPRHETARFSAYRICRASDAVRPTGAPVGAPGVLRPDDAGPGFRVTLPDQWLLPAAEIARPTVVVDWEGCAAYCDRPGPGQDPRLPWTAAPGCQ